MIYHGVQANLLPEDRAEAVAAMPDDEKFDAWMKAFEIKQQQKAVKPGQKAKAMSNEEYMRRFAKIHGDDDEE